MIIKQHVQLLIINDSIVRVLFSNGRNEYVRLLTLTVRTHYDISRYNGEFVLLTIAAWRKIPDRTVSVWLRNVNRECVFNLKSSVCIRNIHYAIDVYIKLRCIFPVLSSKQIIDFSLHAVLVLNLCFVKTKKK